LQDWRHHMELFFVVGSIVILCVFWRLLLRPRFKLSLRGKTVIVTGCDSGFGRALAERLCSEGCFVFAGCLTSASVDELAAKHMEGMKPFILDITKEADVMKAVALVESTRPLHAVINNAGISAFGYAELLPIQRYKINAEVNFIGAVRMCKAFLPLLRKTTGRIVNVGSVGGRMPSAFGSAYLPTKAAMASFSDCLRQEVHRFGIRVLLIEPGFFKTSLLTSGAKNGGIECKHATSEVLAAYGDFSQKMEQTATPIQMFEKLNGGVEGVRAVCDSVVDALSNKFPLPKYVVGWDANLLLQWLPYVPSTLVDWAQTLQA